MFRIKLIVNKYVIVIVLVVLQHVKTNKYVDVMQKLSYSFGLNLLECGDVGNATKSMENEVYNYWNVNHEMNHKSTGCLVLCSMAKLQLLDEEGQLKLDHAEGYVKANGGDDEIFSTLISLYTKCRKAVMSASDPCEVALEVSKCLRQSVHDLGWTPDISSLLLLNTN